MHYPPPSSNCTTGGRWIEGILEISKGNTSGLGIIETWRSNSKFLDIGNNFALLGGRLSLSYIIALTLGVGTFLDTVQYVIGKSLSG